MSKKTINQALKDLFLGLGGDSKALEDNSGVGDYIEDLESAIKGASSSLIDDTEASEDTTYSSSKIEAMLPEIPEPKYITGYPGVYMNMPEGLTRADLINLLPTSNVAVKTNGGSILNFMGIYTDSMGAFDQFEKFAVFCGVDIRNVDNKKAQFYIFLVEAKNGATAQNDKVFIIPLET